MVQPIKCRATFKFTKSTTDRLIEWCLKPFWTVFQLYPGGQCTYPCFPRILLTSTPHNVLSKSLAAIPHNYCRNKRQQRERNESCRNDYHQSSERKLAEAGIEPATSCSQVTNATDWSMGLGYESKTKVVSENGCLNTDLKCTDRRANFGFNSSKEMIIITIGVIKFISVKQVFIWTLKEVKNADGCINNTWSQHASGFHHSSQINSLMP